MGAGNSSLFPLENTYLISLFLQLNQLGWVFAIYKQLR
jgi:hypothetical protein